MNTDEAVKHLISNGFKAYAEKGVVTIVSADRNDLEKMQKLLKDIQYSGSHGWKMDYSNA